jgi:hypothetical protein
MKIMATGNVKVSIDAAFLNGCKFSVDGSFDCGFVITGRKMPQRDHPSRLTWIS